MPSMRRGVRYLALVCGLTFALPPGWCCVPGGQAKGVAPRPGSCCGCDCCHFEQAAANPKPANLPPARLPTHCPCTDRQTILADRQKTDQTSIAVSVVAIHPIWVVQPRAAECGE